MPPRFISVRGLARQQERQAVALVLRRLQLIAAARRAAHAVGVARCVAVARACARPASRPSFSSSVIGDAGGVLLRHLVAPAGEEVAPGDQRVAVARIGLHDRATPRQRSLSRKAIGTSRQASSSARRISSAASILSWPSQKMSASTVEGVADRRLGRKAAAVDLRRDRLDDDALGGELSGARPLAGRAAAAGSPALCTGRGAAAGAADRPLASGVLRLFRMDHCLSGAHAICGPSARRGTGSHVAVQVRLDST